MPLSDQDIVFLKGLMKRLEDEPLKPGDALYEPIYSSPGCEDPVALLAQRIKLSTTQSVQFFSGFRGAGKTTELYRLRKNLEAQGYLVVYGDALEFLNPSEEIDISDLLMGLAGSFNEAMQSFTRVNPAQEGWLTRLKNFLTRTDVEVSGASLKSGAETPFAKVLGGFKTEAELKLAFKNTPSFRQELRTAITSRLGQFKQHVDKFFEDAVKALRDEAGKDVQIVFLFDQLEQLRGSLLTEDAVLRSVEQLFSQHLDKLTIPYVHVVYTVPPWLQFIRPGSVSFINLPSVRQWNNDAKRTHHEPGWDALRALVVRRFGGSGFSRFFGDAKPQSPKARKAGSGPATLRSKLADELIEYCGGHFRDLLRLLRETVVRAESLPVTAREIKHAIGAVRESQMAIAADDALWLHRIGQLRDTALQSTSHADVSRLTRFLDTHFVLYLRNGKVWYDLHPLIRDRVEELMNQQKKSSAKA